MKLITHNNPSSPKNVTWNDRWEMKLFLGKQGTARGNGSEMNNLNQVQSS